MNSENVRVLGNHERS